MRAAPVFANYVTVINERFNGYPPGHEWLRFMSQAEQVVCGGP